MSRKHQELTPSSPSPSSFTSHPPPKQQHPQKIKKHPLHIITIEEHHEALPALHWSIRKKHLPINNLLLVHVDAHPDLCIPNTISTTSDCWASPHLLYDKLRCAVDGIAGWILPTVITGIVNEVWWIRPPSADQLNDGVTNMRVGEKKKKKKQDDDNDDMNALQSNDGNEEEEDGGGGIGVDYHCSYYLDEGLATDANELCHDDARTVTLRVGTTTTLDTTIICSDGDNSERNHTNTNKHWWLDICLDYFACANVMEQDLGLSQHDIDIIHDAVRNATWRQMADDLSTLHGNDNDNHVTNDGGTTTSERNKWLRNTSAAHRAALQSCDIDKLATFYNDNDSDNPIAKRWCDFMKSLDDDEPKQDRIMETAHCSATLPSFGEWGGMKALETFLVTQKTKHNMPPPRLVTIARSEQEGYYPNGKQKADDITKKLVEMIDNIWGEDVDIVFHAEDEGDDVPWIGLGYVQNDDDDDEITH